MDGELVPTVPVTNIWTDVPWQGIAGEGGVTLKQGKKPEKLLQRLLELCSAPGDLAADYFAGTATTCAVAHKLQRRWLGIEVDVGNCEKALRRLKSVTAGEQSGVSSVVNWRGGGFFKYYELEQYEDALRHCVYREGDLFDDPHRGPYRQYVFMADPKMLDAWQVDLEEGKAEVHLSRLYEGIDIAETLANLKGKWIRRIGENHVEFEDGEVVRYDDPEFYKVIKPLVWW